MIGDSSFRNFVSSAQRRLRRWAIGRGRSLEKLTVQQRRDLWPPAKRLQERHVRNCRLVENRRRMLELLPKGAVCAEVGIDQCRFSARIVETTAPTRLHLIDIAQTSIARARELFAREIASGQVETHLGDSSTLLRGFPDGYFNWIYIDGDHFYEGVRRDLEAARLKVAAGGLIALNDYVFFSSSDFCKYGVVEAVNEFCLEHDWEFVFFALNTRMYNDVVLRKIVT